MAACLGGLGTSATGCTYGPDEEASRVAQIVGLGDSYHALIVVEHDRFRRPTGLSAFPDGGKWKFLERDAYLYLVDARDAAVSTLTHQVAADSLWESFSARVAGLEGDSVAYVRMVGCARNGECYPDLQTSATLRVSMNGTVQSVSGRPAEAVLPGIMLARRPGERSYVRFSTEGDVVTARFEEGGRYRPLFQLGSDGLLTTTGG